MDKPASRLFIALPVEDSESLRSLSEVIKNLKKHQSSLKIVPAVNYHITIKFIGSVESEIAESFSDAFLELQHLKKVEYKIEGIGTFPSIEHPLVIWAGLNCDTKPLTEIIQSVDELADRFGFSRETKKFVPHLTLARLKREDSVHFDLKDYIKKENHSLFTKSVFTELVLFESILTRTGAEYKKIGVIKLG